MRVCDQCREGKERLDRLSVMNVYTRMTNSGVEYRVRDETRWTKAYGCQMACHYELERMMEAETDESKIPE